MSLYLFGVLAAVLGVAVSIGLHEVGHMVPAKRFGVRVTQYMIGFGPTVWSRRGSETEYGVKAIPLGGYVRMIGMYPPPRGAAALRSGGGVAGRLEALAEEARQAAWHEVPPGEEHRAFYRLSVPKRVVVMMGGPTMNLLISIGLFAVLLVGLGLPAPTTTVATVHPCVPAHMASRQAAEAALADPGSLPADDCPEGSAQSPAAGSGLVAGDRITSIDGTDVDTWSELTDVTRVRPGQAVVLGVETSSGVRTVDVELATAYRPATDAQGRTTGGIQETGYLGVSPQSEYVSQPWSAVPETMWDITVRSGQALVALPARVVELASDLVTGQARDPEGPVSVVGIGRISGEVAAAEDAAVTKVASLVSIIAGLNLFLFLFNLLPVLPLDGGHVAGALYEGARRQVALRRGRPDPGPVDLARALPIAYAVGILLVALSSVVIIADLINPISLYG
ncbi:MAG: site-2 protease family protein [Candidatus Nanopelagicales bacterium]